MTTKEKINYLITLGIPIRTIAKYSGYNETHISKYAKGLISISLRCENSINEGILALINDMEELR